MLYNFIMTFLHKLGSRPHGSSSTRELISVTSTSTPANYGPICIAFNTPNLGLTILLLNDASEININIHEGLYDMVRVSYI